MTQNLAQIKPLVEQSKGERDGDAEGEGQDNCDPRAMLIWAKYLGLRGQYRQGIKLLRKVLPLVEPVPFSRKYPKDLRLMAAIEPPWIMFSWLTHELIKKGPDDRSDSKVSIADEGINALRLGASEFQDPGALMLYAQFVGREESINAYEQCISKAATAGDIDACRKLANFYYLISLGKYPRCGTPAAKNAKLDDLEPSLPLDPGLEDSASSKSFYQRVLSYFQPRSLEDYRSIAKEWYLVGLRGKSLQSGLNLARIYQQEGNFGEAEAILEEVKNQSLHDKRAAKYNGAAERLIEANLSGQVSALKIEDLDL